MRTPDRITEKDVLLIYMPFTKLSWPPLGLSLLKSAVSERGVSAKIFHFNLLFAKLISVDSYQDILEHSNRYNQVCEWMFSAAIFGTTGLDEKRYVEEILRKPFKSHMRYFPGPMPGKTIRTVLKARKSVDRFLQECGKEVFRCKPKIVGFSSTYQQHVASLALAKRIKQHSPGTSIVFGGPNCQGILGVETLRKFEFVDAVVSGEGDAVFPEMVRRIREGEPLCGLQGVYTQTGPHPPSNNGHYPDAPTLVDMDGLPYPDYGDFFGQFEKILKNFRQPRSIPIETSRGCWWGEKKHCTFCGLNGANIRYRSKSASRVLNELSRLSDRYDLDEIQINDNIFPTDYFKSLLPDLARNKSGIKFTCNVRANITKEQVQLLHNANFVSIQPGIESLSSPVLELMQKGVSHLQNVQILKWCKEFGIIPVWNLLCGFPAEPEEEYDHMANLIPKLVHLTPPHGAGAFFLDRFSPNFKNAEKLGLIDVAPVPSYYFIYPFERESVYNLSYFFSYDYSSGQNFEKYVPPVINEWRDWKRHHDSCDMFFVDEDNKLFLYDQRPLAVEPLFVLSGIHRVLYLACDRIQTISRLKKEAETYTGKEYCRNDIARLLQPMMDRHLMIQEGDRYLGLAIPVGNYLPNRAVFEKFQGCVQERKCNEDHRALMRKIKIKELPREFQVGEEEISRLKI